MFNLFTHGGCVVLQEHFEPGEALRLIEKERCTIYYGMPHMAQAMYDHPDRGKRDLSSLRGGGTLGSPAQFQRLIEMGAREICHIYGLTETYGHITETLWKDEWEDKPDTERYAIKARQGVGHADMEEVTVLDDRMQQVPWDGETVGEIMARGNVVMKGYLKNPEETAKAFKGGYFHSGDIAFQHPDGYIKITDRAKDVIISGGENVSSVEVEDVLMHHPAVALCAVVAKPDEKWGEVPCAFVELKEGAKVTEDELIAHTRAQLAGFKTPKKVVFTELPKTSTGKIQKFELRKMVADL